MLGHQAFQPHAARSTEQVRSDLALFEVTQENPIGPACEQAGNIGLAHR
jgi:hypothetical protein